MRLTDLKAKLYRHEVGVADKGHGRRVTLKIPLLPPRGPNREPMTVSYIQWGGFPIDRFCPVDSVAEADRVMFICPKEGCSHRIAVDFAGRGTPDSACVHNSEGKPVRWAVSGNTIEDLTLAPSILIIGGCAWHGFVEQGAIRTC